LRTYTADIDGLVLGQCWSSDEEVELALKDDASILQEDCGDTDEGGDLDEKSLCEVPAVDSVDVLAVMAFQYGAGSHGFPMRQQPVAVRLLGWSVGEVRW